MLTQIHIRDLATIAEAQLNLCAGTTMITGETGAGKSIFIEAIELTLGGRASANLIRPGKEKAEISLCFDLTKFPTVIAALQAVDLYTDNECIIRRVITNEGPSRSYVNGSPVPLQLVKELGELLFHLHGQHEQQVLLKAETQRDMLDRFAEHLPLVAEVRQLAEHWKTLEEKIQHLRTKTAERSERSEFLNYQLEELRAIKLEAGEWERLEAEHKRLAHAEELMRQLQQVTVLLSAGGEHHPVLVILNNAQRALESVQQVEPKTREWLETLQSAVIPLSELASDLENYLESTELDPEKLQTLEERVSQIFNLARKHKTTPAELIALRDHLESELTGLNSSDEDLLALQKEQAALVQQYTTAATKLSASRKKAAGILEKTITTTIRSLSLPYGEFKISFETETSTLSSHGTEKIIFLIKTNPDQSLQPLAKVISGGELSRLSLAAHLALAHRTTIPTLVFDEVDTGLSGATAEKIGKLLRKLGDAYQVYCVTHQPQVAACGHQHLLVEKYFIDKTTHTRLRLLNHEEQTQELARMLGGEKITEKTLAHAKEMLELVPTF